MAEFTNSCWKLLQVCWDAIIKTLFSQVQTEVQLDQFKLPKPWVWILWPLYREKPTEGDKRKPDKTEPQPEFSPLCDKQVSSSRPVFSLEDPSYNTRAFSQNFASSSQSESLHGRQGVYTRRLSLLYPPSSSSNPMSEQQLQVSDWSVFCQRGTSRLTWDNTHQRNSQDYLMSESVDRPQVGPRVCDTVMTSDSSERWQHENGPIRGVVTGTAWSSAANQRAKTNELMINTREIWCEIRLMIHWTVFFSIITLFYNHRV